jgi:hypothetical protein
LLVLLAPIKTGSKGECHRKGWDLEHFQQIEGHSI